MTSAEFGCRTAILEQVNAVGVVQSRCVGVGA